MNGREFQNWLMSSARRPLVMGILNVTPDSFSDGGQFSGAEAAVEHARSMVAAGADLIDVGGESTRPGASRVPADEQIRRIVPVIAAIRKHSDIALSVDTTLADVAAAALDAGADVLNDISAGREDSAMFGLAAGRGCPIVLMHMQGEPGTMQVNPRYENVTREVGAFLLERVEAAVAAGVARRSIVIDPGIGFGKSLEHNLQLLRDLEQLNNLGHRLLIGVSRKRFIGVLTGVDGAGSRVIGSCAAAAWCLMHGADILRVHDVEETCQTVDVVGALMQS